MKIDTLKLSEKLFDRYDSNYTIESYYGLLAYYELAQTAVAAKDKGLIKK